MLNELSISKVDASVFSSSFRRPLYDSYCFSKIPSTIKNIFGIDVAGLPDGCLPAPSTNYNKVVVFFIDAFGWRFFEQYRGKFPVLERLEKDGVISKLTSQFPSTTVAHVTAMNTGLPVGQHGLYEWNYYEPKADGVIQPFLFSYAGETERNTMLAKGIDPKDIFPNSNIYQELKQRNIPSHLFLAKEIATGAYADVLTKDAMVHPTSSLSEALTNVGLSLKQDDTGYYYLYFAGIDTISHLYGPESEQVAAEISLFLMALENFLSKMLANKKGDTLFLMTADHGQVNTGLRNTYYLNLELPEIIPLLKTSKDGKPIIPVGSPRDFFLHVKDESLEATKAILESKLNGIAEVHLVSELINQGFFGPLPLSEVFLSRVGNLVILPFANKSVWWFEEGRFSAKYEGHHGGLTPQEMDTILYSLEL